MTYLSRRVAPNIKGVGVIPEIQHLTRGGGEKLAPDGPVVDRHVRQREVSAGVPSAPRLKRARSTINLSVYLYVMTDLFFVSTI